MKLLIISDMAHYCRPDGMIVGHGATARELDHLAALFTEVRHIAVLHGTRAPADALPYTAENLTLVPLLPTGGTRWREKWSIVRRAPATIRAIQGGLAWADAVHVRAPCSVALLALLALTISAQPPPERRWVKYAGAWDASVARPLSYAVQRWWLLRNGARAWVTVNGAWAGMPPHVLPFDNPCLTDDEAAEGARAAAAKTFAPPYRLLFVGAVTRAKGVDRALRLAADLNTRGVPLHLDVIGESAERADHEAAARTLGLTGCVTFHGGLPRPQIGRFYAAAHFLILPSQSEGLPKAICEALAYGALPITFAVGAVAQTLREIGAGAAVPLNDQAALTAALTAYLDQPERWQAQAQRGAAAALRFTYSAYLKRVRVLFGLGNGG